VANPGVPEGLTEREHEIYQLTVVNRLTQRQIGERMGISQQAVSVDLAQARAKLPPVDLDAVRQESMALHRRTQQLALELAEMPGAPVTAGKDGVQVYDVDGSIVRDYSLRLAALETARKSDVEMRKLHGLDAAQKHEVSGSVNYTVSGVDVSKLS
jgi:hypothetical protein